NSIRLVLNNVNKRVAGIEPASLAWKAKGYSRRRFSSLSVSNSKPNMKLWFHSAPLWRKRGNSWTKMCTKLSP
ncbi:hypothetical protein M569_00588, partial [Genlisea aurea]